MSKLIWDIMDIVVTIVIVGLGLPVMADVTSRTMDYSYHEFDSVQEKTLLQTDAELFDDDPTISDTYFTKYEIAGMFLAQQGMSSTENANEVARPTVVIIWNGSVLGTFEDNSTPVPLDTWEEQTVSISENIYQMPWFSSLPEDRVFRMRDHLVLNMSDYIKDGVEFYGEGAAV